MTVLVLGASGRLGPHVVTSLLERGQRVRALTRDPGRAAAILPPAAELVHGEFADTATVERELQAADAVLVLTPHGPQMAEVQNRLIDLAAKAGTRIVKVSGTSAGIHPGGPGACRQHWESEQHLVASGAEWVVIRPNAFMQTLIAAMARTLGERRIIANPLGAAGISLIDCADVGAATAAVLTDPAHGGHRYVLTGPSAPTYREIAAVIEAETGIHAQVVDVTPEQAGQVARASGASDWEAGHLAEMLTLFASRASENVTGDVADLTGREPASARDFVRAHRQLFTG
jgi:uncharacterized protein YbjT (DUF2867 family)